MAGTYLKKHAVIDLHVTHVQPPATLHWRPSNSYQVNNGQSSGQSNSGPAELKAVELTKLSYSYDTQFPQINQGTREDTHIYSYVEKKQILLQSISNRCLIVRMGEKGIWSR